MLFGNYTSAADYIADVAGDADTLSSGWEAFSNSFLMILVSELGDKTFFIAALLASRHDRLLVFIGAFTAMVGMTILSTGIGVALPFLLSREYTHWAATLLFAYFGQRLLREAFEMLRIGSGAGPSDELEEVEQELKDGAKHNKTSVLMQALMLTFLAEWGDRSQIATIALAAAKEPLGVVLGGTAGHACCTGVAVLGGHMLAAQISERVICATGGIFFLVFAIHGVCTGA